MLAQQPQHFGRVVFGRCLHGVYVFVDHIDPGLVPRDQKDRLPADYFAVIDPDPDLDVARWRLCPEIRFRYADEEPIDRYATPGGFYPLRHLPGASLHCR